jgi:hypothetical protein
MARAGPSPQSGGIPSFPIYSFWQPYRGRHGRRCATMCAAWLFGSAGAGEIVAYSLQRSEICQREPRMPHRSSDRGGGRDPVEADIVERGAVAERLGASRPRPVLMDADDRVVDTIDNVDIRAVIEGRGACPVDVVGIPIRSVTPAIAIFTCPCLWRAVHHFACRPRDFIYTRPPSLGHGFGLSETRLARLLCSAVFRQTKNLERLPRSRPCEDSSVVEQMTVNHRVTGSNPVPALPFSLKR